LLRLPHKLFCLRKAPDASRIGGATKYMIPPYSGGTVQLIRKLKG
jgi:hypothetical protein